MSQTATVTITPDRQDPKSLVDKFGLSPEAMSPVERRSAISGYDMRYRIEALVAGVSKKKIKHVYVGDGAATAPGVMYLPLIPAASLFPMRHVRVLLGYTAHEISHQLKTDFGLLNAMIADPNMTDLRKQQLKQFWNGIEDYRIEKLVRADYPGFHVFIDDTRDFTARRFVEQVDAGMVPQDALANPYRIGAVALTWLGARMNAYKTRAPADALARLEPNLRLWIEGWEDDMARVQTCVDARDLAAKILDELDYMRQHQPPAPQQQQNPQGQTGQGQSGQGQSGQPGQAHSGQGQPQSGNGGDGTQSGGDAGNGSSNEAGGREPKGDGAGKDGAETGDDAAGKAQGGSANGKDKAADDGEATEAGRGKNANAPDAGPDQNGQDGRSGGTDGNQDDGGAGQQSGTQPGSQNQGQSGGDGGSQSSQSGGDDGDQSSQAGGGGDQSRGGSGAPRPHLNIKDGDEKSRTEEADLEIDDLQKAINSMKGTKAKDARIRDGDALNKMAKSKGETEAQAVQKGQAKYAAIRRSIAAPAARAAGVMRRLLQSTAKRRWRGGKEEGDLDFNRIVPMVNGAPDVHRQMEVRRSVNSALLLLVDNSASMTGHPIQVCQETSVVLDMAVSGTPTNIEITGFTGSRTSPVLYRYRAFGQKGQAAAATLGNMHEVSLGGTPVSIPLLEGWRRISAQKEPRRIIIVVSDGGAEDPVEAREAHDFIVSQGCTILGIAIGHPGPMSAWCDNVHGISSVNELPTALTMLVQGVLR